MNNNFYVILKYSLKPKVFNKGFIKFALIVLVGSLVLINGLAFLLVSDSQEDVDTTIYVYSENQETAQEFISSSSYLEINDNYTLETTEDIVDVSETSDVVLDIDNKIEYSDTESSLETSNLISQLFTTYDTLLYLNANDLTADQLSESQNIGVYETKDIKTITEPDTIDNSLLYPISFITSLAFYFIFILVINFIGQEILEEKKSRAMEIIITNISPTSHLLAKVLSNIISVILILLVLIFSIIISLVSALIIFDIDISIYIDILKSMLDTVNIQINLELVLTIILLVLTTLTSLISLITLVAIFASTVSNQEDYQRIISPLMIIVMIPYFIGLFPGFEGVKTVLTYVPIVSTFFVGTQYISANIGLLQLFISFVLNVMFLVLIVKLLVPVYRVGVLNYSSRPLKEILKMSREDKKYRKDIDN